MITTIKNRFDDFREDARKKLLDRKESCEKELYALRSIKRVKKKDWTDFQSFMKNFSMADDVSYRVDWSYRLFWNDIIIYYKWVEVILSNCTTDKEFVEGIRSKTPDRVVRESLLHDRVYYTPDEFIEYQVNKKIEYREDYLAELELAIVQFDSTCWDLYDKLLPVLECIKSIKHESYTFKKIAADTLEQFTDY